MSYNTSAENEYVTIVDSMGSLPETIIGSVEQISYAGHIYVYGSEGFGSEIKLLEAKFIQYLNEWYVQAINNPSETQVAFLTLNRLQARLNQLNTDDVRALNLIDWKSGSNHRLIDPIFPQSVRQQILTEQKACRFFYECLSEQMNSIDRVLQVITGYASALNQVVTTDNMSANTQHTVLFFHISDDIGIREFDELTRTLKSELYNAGFTKEELTLANIRDLFEHPKRKLSTDNPTFIHWLKPYITLADFVKQLRIASIITDERPSVYTIAVNRFHDKNGVAFAPRKLRQDNRPNAKDAASIDDIIALIRRSSTDALK